MDSIKHPSVVGQMIGLLEDHVDLAHLEYQYESSAGRKRLMGALLAGLFGLSAFVFIQGAIVLGLLRTGMPLYAVFLTLAAAWAALAVYFYTQLAQRQQGVGEPFETSRKELSRTLQWIQQHFF